MKFTKTILAASVFVAGAALVIGGASGLAADDSDGKKDEARKDHARLAEFEATGESKLCLRTRSIKRTEVLDDYTILFHMRGKEYFVNRLSHRCYGLGFHKSFGYTLSTSLLCNVDIITVLESTGTGISCGLGDFEELIPAQPTEEEPAEDPIEG